MSSVLAIVSKAVFEKQAAGASIGSTLALEHYASLHKSLATLGDGGSLFLVTVRPPNEALWLVAVLDDPETDKTGWGASANRTPIVDISKLKKQLVFTSGTGIQAKPGALGMSLQTPRGLTTEDESLLRAAAGTKPAKKAAARSATSASRASKPSSASSTKSAKSAKPSSTKSAKSSKPSSTKSAKSSKPSSASASSTKSAKSAKPSSASSTTKSSKPSSASSTKSTKSAKPSSTKSSKPSKPSTKSAKPSSTKPSSAKQSPSGDHLAVLQRAVAAKDGAAALTAALAWWRDERSPALANLIDDISERVSGPAVTTELEFTKLAGAVNPLDLGRLLPAARKLQVNFLITVAERLERYPDDPRITAAFGTWLVPPITTSISKSAFWTVMNRIVQRTRDTRAIRPLKKRIAAEDSDSAWWVRFLGNLRRTQEKLETVEPPDVDVKPLAKLALGKLAPIAASTNASPAAKSISIVPAPPAPKLTGPLLAQAATHLTANRIVAAIDAIVERWRQTRVPALAGLVDRASRLLPHFDRPLISHHETAFEEWIAAFEADPVGRLPQLLQTIGAGDTPKTSELQIVQIASLPDDPRISSRFTEIAGRYIVTKSATFGRTLFETLARHRDVRSFDLVREHYQYSSNHAKRFMEKMVDDPKAAFDAWPLALDAADEKLFATLDKKVTAAVAKAEARERELIQGIVDDRKSAAPREVYADWLMDREHPRGERIMLAAKRSRTEAEDARLEELRAIPYVFGSMRDLVEGSDEDLFRNAKVHYGSNTISWRNVAANPLVALVENLDFDEGETPTKDDFAAFVAAATSLAEIRPIHHERLETMDPEYTKRWKLVGKGANAHLVRI